MEYRIITAPGTEHEHTFETAALWSMTIHKPLITGNIGVGFCPTSYIVTKLSLGDAIIPRTAEVKVWGRETPDAEWQPLGTYWVGKRTKSERGQLEITAYNAMRKAQQNYAAITKITTWPAPMADVVADIASILGVTVDPRTAIKTGTDYVVSNPLLEYPYASSGTLTMHEVLSWIAAAHGGSFVVTDANALYLVPLAPAADAVVQDIGSNCRKLSLVADPLTISRVTVWTGSETHYTAGDDAGYNLELDCPYATQTICDDLLAQLGGYTYIPFEAERAEVGMTTQPGDLVRIKDVTYYVGGMDISCGARFLADLRTPATVETDDEFPVKSSEERQLERVKASVSQQVGTLDKNLNQEEIFKRLTQDGEILGLYMENGQLYINASYIRSGEFLADLIKAGVIKSKDGKSVIIDLDKGTVDIKGSFKTEVLEEDGRTYFVEISPGHIKAKTNDRDITYVTDLFGNSVSVESETSFLQFGIPVDSDFPELTMTNRKNGINNTVSVSAYASDDQAEVCVSYGDSREVYVYANKYGAQIGGLTEPASNQDAANKEYVDESIGSITKEGLGAMGYKRQLTSADDMNNTTEDGVYWYSTADRPANAPFPNAAVVLVFGNEGDRKIQIAFRYGTDGYGRFRAMQDGTWRKWAEFAGLIEDTTYLGCYYRYVNDVQEWVNPPMVPGVEYRTTERSDGKPVYARKVNIGTLPATGEKSATYSGTAATLVRANGRAINSSGVQKPLPFYTSAGALRAFLDATKYTVYVYTLSDLSSYTCTIDCYYTKD